MAARAATIGSEHGAEGGVVGLGSGLAHKKERDLQKAKIKQLQADQTGLSSTNAAFETETHMFDLPERGTVSIRGNWIPDPVDWAEDLWDGIQNAAGTISGMTADLLDDAISTVIDSVPDITTEDFVLKSGEIIVDTIRALNQTAIEMLERSNGPADKWVKAIMRFRYVATFSASTLIGTDVFEQLQQGDNDCAICIGFVKFVFEAFCSGVGTVGCTYVTFPISLGLSASGCKILADVVCGYATLLLPEAEAICSSSTTPSFAGYC